MALLSHSQVPGHIFRLYWPVGRLQDRHPPSLAGDARSERPGDGGPQVATQAFVRPQVDRQRRRGT